MFTFILRLLLQYKTDGGGVHLIYSSRATFLSSVVLGNVAVVYIYL